MIDGYVYAEIKKMLQTADADAFDGYALTAHISERDLTKYSQALYPLLKNYFSSPVNMDMSTREGFNNAMEKLELDKASNDKDYLELSCKYSSLSEEALFYKSIIKKLLEVSK